MNLSALVPPEKDRPAETGLRSVEVIRWRSGTVTQAWDDLADEVPIALEYNGISHAVMMASPLDLEDFALGFSLTEGILQGPSELFGCEVMGAAEGLTLRLEISNQRFARLKDRRRSLAGRTGCGLCGAESLEQLFPPLIPVDSGASFRPEALHQASEALRARQILQRSSGATHAAAWISPAGEVLEMREDVGRHNALDKLIGALARRHRNGFSRAVFSEGAVLLTSRASSEMVQKAAIMGIGLLAAISAPTALAVRLAEGSGMTLAGFVRPGSLVAYSHPTRLGLHSEKG